MFFKDFRPLVAHDRLCFSVRVISVCVCVIMHAEEGSSVCVRVLVCGCESVRVNSV